MKRKREKMTFKRRKDKENKSRKMTARKESKNKNKTEKSILKQILATKTETHRTDSNSGRISETPSPTISLRRKMMICTTSLDHMPHQMDSSSLTTASVSHQIIGLVLEVVMEDAVALSCDDPSSNII